MITSRWFRLRANCLFYFRLSPNNARPPFGAQPLGLLLLERFHVQKETFEDNVNAFSIIFSDEPGKKHMFVAESERNARQWESALKKASYQKMREQLVRDYNSFKRLSKGIVNNCLQSRPVNTKQPCNITWAF